MPVGSDRNLLFGMLALQMDFISRSALIEAMQAWLLDKSRSLGEILVERGALIAANRSLLEPLVEAHIKQHGGDARRSLAALSSDAGLGQDLQRIDDVEIRASIAALPKQSLFQAGALSSAAPINDPDAPSDSNAPPSEPAPLDPYRTQQYETNEPQLRYRVLRPHAEGGLGRIYVAIDQELNREVAFKEIRQDRVSSKEARDRFRIEAEITGGLEHPGIVPVYGLGHYADGRPFYAMRFIRGDSLLEAVRRFHRKDDSGRSMATSTQDFASSLPFRDMVKRLIDVCNAIQYAHDRGVLHRDLKPDNIMLGQYGETLVVDWGLAKAGNEQSKSNSNTSERPFVPVSGSQIDATQYGQAMGTYGFMSPEQSEGKLDLLGPASDVYSLGATLYAILTGEAPLRSFGLAELLTRLRKGDIPSPRSIQSKTPRPLEAICQKAMALELRDRYTSARALTEDLTAWLADQPVSAYREPMMMRTRRWLRRHPVAVSTTSVGLIITLVGLGLFSSLLAGKNSELAELNNDLTSANYRLDTAKSIAEAELEFETGFLPMQSRPNQFSKADCEKLAPSILQLRQLDDELADSKYARVVQAYGLGIRLRVESPDLSITQITSCEKDFDELKRLARIQTTTEIEKLVLELDELIAQRSTKWMTAFRPEPETYKDEITVRTATVLEAVQLPTAQLIDQHLTLPSKGVWQIGPHIASVAAVRFSCSIQPHQPDELKSFELSLNAKEDSYLVRLNTSNNNDAENRSMVNVEILRAGIELHKSSFASAGYPWRLTAEMDRGQIAVTVNDHELRVKDLYAMDGQQVICLLHNDCRLVLENLQIDMKPTPAVSTIIEMADFKYISGNFDAAKQLYQRSDSNEAQFKAAICELRLGDRDNAKRTLKLLFAKQASLDVDQPWHLLSSMYLFGLLSEQDEYTSKHDVLMEVVANYRTVIGKHFPLLPPRIREQVFQHCRRDGARGRLSMQPQGDVSLLRFAVEIESQLPEVPPERHRATRWRLADALRAEGSHIEAENILRQLVFDVQSDSQASVQELVTLIQDLVWHYIALEKYDKAEKLLADHTPADALQGLTSDRAVLLLEKARLLANQGRSQDAMNLLSTFFEVAEKDLQQLTHGQFADACAFAGYLYSEIGNQAIAQNYWQKGLRRNWKWWDRDKQDLQGYGYREINLSLSMSFELVLHSLTGKSRPIDLEENALAELGQRSASSHIASLAKMFPVPSFLLNALLKNVFDVPEIGERWRRDMVYRKSQLKEYYSRPVILIVNQAARVLFFAGIRWNDELKRDCFLVMEQLMRRFDQLEIQIEGDFPRLTTFLLSDYKPALWEDIRDRYDVSLVAGLGMIKVLKLSKATRPPLETMRQLIDDVRKLLDVPQSFLNEMDRILDAASKKANE